MDLLLSADHSRLFVEEYLEKGECFVAEHNDQIIGVYVLIQTRPRMAELVNIAVVERQQGKGIGKQLILNAIQTAKVKGYKTLEVGTGNSSIGQLALYQKWGFRIIGVYFHFLIRHYPEKIFENGIQCRDMIRLSQDL